MYRRHFASPTQTGEPAEIEVMGGERLRRTSVICSRLPTRARVNYLLHHAEQDLKKRKVSGAYRRTCLLGPAGFYDPRICCSAVANCLGNVAIVRLALGHFLLPGCGGGCALPISCKAAKRDTYHASSSRLRSRRSIYAIACGFQGTPLALNQLVMQLWARWERVRSPVVWLAV
jgi:hypothetical protein